MASSLQVFQSETNEQVRVFVKEGEPWFVLADVCAVLEIGNPSDAARRLDADEKDALDIIDPIGRKQTATIINESGLYSLILTSRKESAKRFKKWITSKVLPSIRKTGSYRGVSVPAFLRRASANWDRVDRGHFSVISELEVRFWARMERAGHVMADRAKDGRQLRPDVSAGRLFADWLSETYPMHATNYRSYPHVTDEAEFDARQYPNSTLPLFIEFLETVWMPQHSERYFRSRDPAALPYLAKILPQLARSGPIVSESSNLKPMPARWKP